MKVSTSDYVLNAKLVENAKGVVLVDDRMNETDATDKMNPAMKMYYQDYMQKVMLSDGSDPDNQPEW